MSSMDLLSNVDLRLQLKRLGATVGPITSTTRAIYVKKLQHLKKLKLDESGKVDLPHQKSNGNHISSSNLGKVKRNTNKHRTLGFSSDESDNDEEKKKPTKTNPSHEHRILNKDAGRSLSKQLHKRAEVGGDRRLTRSCKSIHQPPISSRYSDDNDDSNEDSWVQVTSVQTNTSPGLVKSNSVSLDSSQSLHNQNLSHRSPLEKAQITSVAESPLTRNRKNNDLSSKDKDTTCSVYRKTATTTRNGDVIRRRAISEAMKHNIPNYLDSPETFTDNSLTVTANPKNEKVSLCSRIFSLFSKKSRNTRRVEFIHSEDSSTTSWSLHCSSVLPICTVIFFVILGLLYITMRSDDLALSTGPPLDFSTQTQDNIHQTMKVVNSIYEILATSAGNTLCNISSDGDILSINQLKLQLKVGNDVFLKALHLIREHPEWELFLYKDLSGEKLHKNDRIQSVHFMEAKQAILPTFCRFKRAIRKVLFRVAIILLAGLLVWLFVLLRQYRLRKKEEERQKMFVMVEKILDVLKKHYVSSCMDDKIEPFIPIVHVRDMIISPQDRRSKAKEWEEAVKFLSARESRIRVETQRVSGEDFRVWRWIQVTSPNKREQAPGRVWHGEAFDPHRSANIPSISPTPCLKIRNMFNPDVEKDADWPLQVQDSILEKCSDNLDILSIVVEKKSREGLVYMKCGTCAGAGKAFKSLHGSWFDGRLVTVKFIKLQRFHTRYPDTVEAIMPLKPNSSNPVSTILPSDDNAGDYLTSTPLK